MEAPQVRVTARTDWPGARLSAQLSAPAVDSTNSLVAAVGEWESQAAEFSAGRHSARSLALPRTRTTQGRRQPQGQARRGSLLHSPGCQCALGLLRDALQVQIDTSMGSFVVELYHKVCRLAGIAHARAAHTLRRLHTSGATRELTARSRVHSTSAA